MHLPGEPMPGTLHREPVDERLLLYAKSFIASPHGSRMRKGPPIFLAALQVANYVRRLIQERCLRFRKTNLANDLSC